MRIGKDFDEFRLRKSTPVPLVQKKQRRPPREEEAQDQDFNSQEIPLTIDLLHKMKRKLVNIKNAGVKGRRNSYLIVNKDTPSIGGEELDDFPKFIKSYYIQVDMDHVIFKIYQILSDGKKYLLDTSSSQKVDLMP